MSLDPNDPSILQQQGASRKRYFFLCEIPRESFARSFLADSLSNVSEFPFQGKFHEITPRRNDLHDSLSADYPCETNDVASDASWPETWKSGVAVRIISI